MEQNVTTSVCVLISWNNTVLWICTSWTHTLPIWPSTLYISVNCKNLFLNLCLFMASCATENTQNNAKMHFVAVIYSYNYFTSTIRASLVRSIYDRKGSQLTGPNKQGLRIDYRSFREGKNTRACSNVYFHDWLVGAHILVVLLVT